jgi:hypothetical protein
MNPQRRAVTVATVVAAVALILGVAAGSDASQSSIKIAFGDGRISLFTEEAPASDVLAEWARNGKTEVIGAEVVERRRVTVKLDDVPEAEALEAILGRETAYLTVPRPSESGLSGFARVVIGADAIAKEKPVDRSIPPEATYAYFVGERVLSGEDYGKPVFEPLKELPPAPETKFTYYQPEKATGDYGRPVFEPMDERWVIPEKRFAYFLKDFPKFDVADWLRPPTTYPEIRFKYFCGSKAAPCW